MTLYPNWLADNRCESLEKFTRVPSLEPRVFHDISLDTIGTTFSLYSPPSCQSSNNGGRRRSRSEQIGLHVHFRLEKNVLSSGHVAPWFMRHDNRFVAGSMGIRVGDPSWPSSTSSFSIGTNRIRDKVEWYTDKRFSRFLVRGPRYSYPISLLIYFLLPCFSHSLSPSLNPSKWPRLPRTTRTRCRVDFSQPTRFRDTYARPARLNFKPLHSVQDDSRSATWCPLC